MYYTAISHLTQVYFVPSSITCVNSMEVSYIPIAKARGFTTHWIKYVQKKYVYKNMQAVFGNLSGRNKDIILAAKSVKVAQDTTEQPHKPYPVVHKPS